MPYQTLTDSISTAAYSLHAGALAATACFIHCGDHHAIIPNLSRFYTHTSLSIVAVCNDV